MSARILLDLAEELNESEDFFENINLERICDSAYKMADLCDDFVCVQEEELGCMPQPLEDPEIGDTEFAIWVLVDFVLLVIISTAVGIGMSRFMVQKTHVPSVSPNKSSRRENELKKCLKSKTRQLSKVEADIQKLHELIRVLKTENQRLISTKDDAESKVDSLVHQLG